MNFQINFRQLKKEDAQFVNDLRQIEQMEELIVGNKRPISYERDLKWVNDLISAGNPQIIYYAVTTVNNDDIIGYISISDIDYENETCSFGGLKIGPGNSGKGLGTESTLKLIKYVFEELKMERCKALCLEHHDASLRMLEKAGFKKEGLIRCSAYKQGKHVNQWLLSVIREDYLEIKNIYDL